VGLYGAVVMLTDARARKIKPGEKMRPDGYVPGLSLHPLSKPGRGKWIFRFSSPATGKRRDMGLGTYPEVTIATARKQAFGARERIAGGTDPLEQRRAEQTDARVEAIIPTFEVAARKLFDDVRSGFRNKKHTQQWISTLEK